MTHGAAVHELHVLAREPQVEQGSQRGPALREPERLGASDPIEALAALGVDYVQDARAPLVDGEEPVAEEPANDASFSEVVQLPTGLGCRGRGGFAVPDVDDDRRLLARLDAQMGEGWDEEIDQRIAGEAQQHRPSRELDPDLLGATCG